MSSQNVPLWHKNHFELKAIKKQKTPQKFPLLCLKVGYTFFLSGSQMLISPEKALAESAHKPPSVRCFLPSLCVPTVCCPWKLRTAFLCPVISLWMCCPLLKMLYRLEFQAAVWITLGLSFSYVMCTTHINKLFSFY